MKTAKEIYYDFEGKLVGTPLLKSSVCQTLIKMPDEIINLVTSACWFLGSIKDAWGYTFTGNDLRKDQHLIFLSDSLLSQDTEQIMFSIAHEIGHVILKHRNSTFVKQTKKEIRLQETQADNFAKQFGF